MTAKQKKIALAVIWLLSIVAYWYYLKANSKTPMSLFIDVLRWLKSNPLGAVAFCGAYILRPMILIPASVLAIAAGHCFGFTFGLALTLFSAALAGVTYYGVGRMFGGPQSESVSGRTAAWSSALVKNPWQSTAMMRLAMLPYDPCSFLCGAKRVPFKQFVSATIIGSAPASFSLVLFGSGIKGEFNGQQTNIDWRPQVVALVVMVAAIIVSKKIKAPVEAAPQPEPIGTL